MDPIAGDGAGARSVEPGRGLAWWTEGWALFTKSAVLWIALALLLIIIVFVLGLIPLLGALAASLVIPVFMGSWMLAARKVEGGGTLEIGDLFTCFKGEKLTPLLVMGALLVAAVLVIGIVAGVLGAGALFGMFAGGAHQSMGGMFAALGASMLLVLFVLAVSVLLGMAFWFAPALVVFRGTQPVDALRNSFAASLKNIVPFLIYSVIYFIASIVATIPFGLGWIVLVPVLMLTLYVSYRDIYGS